MIWLVFNLVVFGFPAILTAQQTTQEPRATETDEFFNRPPDHCMSGRLPEMLSEWQEKQISGDAVRVEWTYGNETCSSLSSCFGVTTEDDVSLEPQLLPLQLEEGQTLRFYASPNMDMSYSIRPFLVDQAAFKACDFSRGVAVIPEATAEEFDVPSTFLTPGTKYLIAQTSDPLFECRFGLRLNITVKSENCTQPGETSRCWHRGRCTSGISDTDFHCRCCLGYTGSYCERQDACASLPCQNSGLCRQAEEDMTLYTCDCPLGYSGEYCEHQINNLCDINPCENNATCSGNHDDYTCACLHGYSGHHCEVKDNNCASNPCVHGVCVDSEEGHMCYCIPGYGGQNCDQQFDECQSTPCRNGGFCVDQDDSYRCQCPRGYIGSDCSVKVDLCNPSPCHNATECIDFGGTFTCTCNPGFTGPHCEVNINECESDPCKNGGKCRDEISGYVCTCPKGISGIHCEYERLNLPRMPPQIQSAPSGRHISQFSNMYVIAGTLGGALLLAMSVLLGCYCKVNETYRHVFRWRPRGYSKQSDEPLHQKRLSSSRQVLPDLYGSRPSLDAILEASTDGFSTSSDRSALVNSLKPKRV